MKMNRIKGNWHKFVVYGSLVLLLAACSPTPVATPTEPVVIPPTVTPTMPETLPEATQMSSPYPPPSSTGMESLIERAKNDLAARLSIPVAEISLVETKEVVWPDSSLGCPQPGMEYLQVPEDGAQILLQAQEKVYDYHVGGARGLFLCENASGSPYPPPAAPAAPAVQSPYP